MKSDYNFYERRITYCPFAPMTTRLWLSKRHRKQRALHRHYVTSIWQTSVDNLTARHSRAAINAIDGVDGYSSNRCIPNHFRMEVMATPTTCRCCCRLMERSLRNADEQLEKGVQVHVATLLSAAELHSTMKQISPSLLPTSNGKAKHGTGRTERKPMSRWLDRSIQR